MSDLLTLPVLQRSEWPHAGDSDVLAINQGGRQYQNIARNDEIGYLVDQITPLGWI